KGSGQKAEGTDDDGVNSVVIDTLETANARLIIVPRKKDKAPKIWAIHTLTMHDVGAFTAMPFEATLTNAVPPGEIATKGSFGPTLDRIIADGETETPNFMITDSHHAFALHTKYHSLIDGTNGDTRLESIDATFMGSHLLASGAVLDGPPGTHGRTVTLDAK